ncbi:hypothetical protein [Micromonospora sp. ATCC 39149]|uniref:Uncharacterized protein n=1 Tax=Micromonospora carbonacea TaxID=47853 RepID=A0A7D5YB54_9ACTN|nr:hypothetical protein [Micromonospora sp. ATCC 39149]QLJ99940.1 hypothetical protein HZU44_07630 [Micromonospora carbonacea]
MSVRTLFAGSAGGTGGGPPSVAPLVFGFMPGVQHGLVIGELGTLSEAQNHRVHELAGFLAGEVGATRLPAGVSCGLGGARLLLVSIPVEAVESGSGRAGLCVTLGFVVSSRAEPELWVHILAAMVAAVARSCAVTRPGTRRAADALANRLQGPDGDAVRRELAPALAGLGTFFSGLIGKRVVGDAAPALGESGHDPAYLLAELLAAAFRHGEGEVVARYLPFGGLPGPGSTQFADASLLRFFAGGAVVGEYLPPGSGGSASGGIRGVIGKLLR